MANEKILVDLILNDKDFQKGIKEAVKDTQKMGKEGENSTQMLADGFKFVGAAIAAIGIKELITDLAKTAATAQGVRSAFENSFKNSSQVLEDMRRATGGTVDEVSLMQKALNAKNLKIPIDTLNAGLALARQRAAETGESVEFLAQSVVLGLGRESALILDNLGISAKRLSEETERTGDFMKAAADIINSELKSAPQTVTTLADGMARVTVSIEEMKEAFATSLIPEMEKAIWKFQKLIRFAEFLSDAFSFGGMSEGAQDLLERFTIVEGGVIQYERSLELLRQESLISQDQTEEFIEAIEYLENQFKEAKDSAMGLASSYAPMIQSKKDSTKATEEEAKALAKQLNQLKKLEPFFEKSAEIQILQSMEGEPEVFASGIPTMESPPLKIGDDVAALIPKLQQMNNEMMIANEAVNAFGNTFYDSFEKAAEGAASLGEFMQNWVMDIVKAITQAIIKAAVLQAILSATGLGGVTGFAGSAISGGLGAFGSGFNSSFGGNSNFSLSSTIQGRDIVLSSDRTRGYRGR